MIAGAELGLQVRIHAPLSGGFDEAAAERLIAELAARSALLLVGHEPDLSRLVAARTGGRVVLETGGWSRSRGGSC